MSIRLIGLLVLAVIVLLVLRLAVDRVRNHSRLPRNRERHLRMRLHLRMRPGRGHATGFQLWWHFGRWASYRKSGQTRPSLSKAQRRRDADSHSVFLGRAHWLRGLRLPVQEHLLIFAPPRSGKTQMLARVVVHYPGPVLATSTKADLFLATSGVRQLRGPVIVLNPQEIGGRKAASTVRWSPVKGCEDRSVAIRRADGFANAVRAKKESDNAFFQDCARRYLRAMFHAAALAGGDARLVARWARSATKGGAADAEDILRASGAADWAAGLAELRGAAERTNATNAMVLAQTLGFLDDPALAEAALPGPGEMDVAEFLAESGTLYLIADPSGNDESPLSPYFAALANEVRYQAGMIGQASGSGRLDPPMLMALDEATQICRCPVDSWLADAGGKGVQIAVVVHGFAQLAKTWDDTGARIILDTSGCKVVLPGVDDPDTLDRLSKICGDHSYQHHGQEGWHQHPRMSPSMINQLPDGFALVKRGNLPPVVAKVAAVRRDREVRRAVRGGYQVAILAPVEHDEAIDADRDTFSVASHIADELQVAAADALAGRNDFGDVEIPDLVGAAGCIEDAEVVGADAAPARRPWHGGAS
jgi:type IV secretion system protein VirD4